MEVYVCSNRYCVAVYDRDPRGYCPKCFDMNGSGWSLIRRDVQRWRPDEVGDAAEPTGLT